jgi:hypothetical protein
MPVITPYHDPRHGLGLGRGQPFGGLDEAASRHGDEREGAQARAAVLALAVPADQEGERVGDGEVADVRQEGEVPEVGQ